MSASVTCNDYPIESLYDRTTGSRKVKVRDRVIVGQNWERPGIVIEIVLPTAAPDNEYGRANPGIVKVLWINGKTTKVQVTALKYWEPFYDDMQRKYTKVESARAALNQTEAKLKSK